MTDELIAALRDAYGTTSSDEPLFILLPPFVLSAALAGRWMASRRRRVRVASAKREGLR